MHARFVLEAAVRSAPRRYLLPRLPPDAEAARVADPATALAFAIEAARCAGAGRLDAKAVFIDALAAMIKSTLDAQKGDAAFQGLVLRAQHDEVEEHARLSSQLHAHRRAVRSAVDAVAHPGKIGALPAGTERQSLKALHELSRNGDWAALRDAARADLPSLHESAPLQALVRAQALAQVPSVQLYESLCRERGPLARSSQAAAEGRAAARTGEAAEQATLDAFRRICGMLHETGQSEEALRALGSLRTTAGFTGGSHKAKDEWDAAIVGADATSPSSAADILLLAEVKASPAAATPDWWRLHRGLQRLATADAGGAVKFSSSDGDVRISGASLRELAPRGGDLPGHVIYCCTAPVEARPVMLSAASQAVLLAEPASVEFARVFMMRGAAPKELLAPVWMALTTQPRLRSALHQYETSCSARAVMLHPDDLVAAVEEQLCAGSGASFNRPPGSLTE